MRILVTGADGQLGNEMQVLAKENPQHFFHELSACLQTIKAERKGAVQPCFSR